jgi:hypothetical protein
MIFSTSDLSLRQKEVLDYVEMGAVVLVSRWDRLYAIIEFDPATYPKRLPTNWRETPAKLSVEGKKQLEACVNAKIDERRRVERERMNNSIPPTSNSNDEVVQNPIMSDGVVNEEELF